jgi:SAM-dependent methyltransferase
MSESVTPATGSPRPVAAGPDLRAIKTRQHAAWSSGDYAVVGTTLQMVGESLCEALDLRSGQKVLDVAAGNGNAALAAARRFCDVVASDYVPALLERAGERAAAERLALELREADAENLPFADASFDAVVSTFGVMFTADAARAAAELIRVCRPGGKIGLANWTPEGFIGQLFGTIGRHVPPPPGAKSPALWGTEARLAELFPSPRLSIEATRRSFVFRYRSPAHWLEVFETRYGPVLKAFEALAPAARDGLRSDLLALLARFDRAEDGTLVVPSEYLEVVIRREERAS